MNSAACQKEAFPLAGLLSQLGTGNAWNRSKPDMHSRIAGGAILTITKVYRAAGKVIFLTFDDGVEGFSDITTRERKEFSESIKKGSISNATLWNGEPPDRDFCRMQKSILEQNQSITNSGFLTEIREIKGLAATSIFSQFGTSRVFSKRQKRSLEQNQQIAAPQVNRVNNINSVQPSDVSCFAFRRLRLISPCKAETTNCPVVSPSSFNSSIAFATSCGTRAAIVCDFALTDFVAMLELLRNRCSTVWQKEKECKRLTCSTPYPNLVFNTLSTGKAQEAQQITKPAGATNTNGPLTTTDSESIEAAMKNHTTPLTGRVSLTPNKFTWRFLAISRIDRNAKPCRMSVEASTEREARQLLAPHFILSLSARLPILGVGHA